MTPNPWIGKGINILVMNYPAVSFAPNEKIVEEAKRILEDEENSYDYVIMPEYSLSMPVDMGKLREAIMENKESKEKRTLITGIMYQEGRFFLKNETWIWPPFLPESPIPEDPYIKEKHPLSQEDWKVANHTRLTLLQKPKVEVKNPRVYDVVHGIEYMISMTPKQEKRLPGEYHDLDMLITLGNRIEFREDVPEKKALNYNGLWIVCNRFQDGFAAVNKGGILKRLQPSKKDSNKMCGVYKV